VAVASKALLYVCGSFNVPLSKMAVWFAVRAMLAVCCAVCEGVLYGAVYDTCRRALNKRATTSWSAGVGVSTLPGVFAFTMLTSAGMFGASTSLLPNSLSMYLYMLSFACWIRGRYGFAIALGASSALLGVPFSAILLVFMGFDVIISFGFVRALPWAFGATLACSGAQIVIDWVYYHKWLFAVFNIVFYNALSSETDSTLYGVEPWTFYAKNLFLNLNVVALVAPIAVIAMLLRRSWKTLAIVASPFVWVCLMMYLPHKEQRFMYPIYPLLLLSGSVAISALHETISIRFKRIANSFLWLVLIVVLLLSVSRIAAQTIHRSAPLRVWEASQGIESGTICMGDEWYRFPSSFWLRNDHVRMRFVSAGFHGLLPKQFEPWPHSTYAIPSGMNGKNEEVIDSRIVSVSECDYMVVEDTQKVVDAGASVVASYPLIDDARSSSLFRAFYVPIFSPKRNRFHNYGIVKLP
jgi:alpha-1,2-mannosyltransferase